MQPAIGYLTEALGIRAVAGWDWRRSATTSR